MDAQPQRLWRPEFFPLHHCNMLTASGTKPPWQRDKAGAKVFLAEKKQALKIDPMTPQSDHTLPLREHFHSNLRRHTSESIIPTYSCLLWWRAVIPEREMCYCEWNLFRSLLSLSGKMCWAAAMGGSINLWNRESCAQKRWLSPPDAAAALCLCQQRPAQLRRGTRAQGAAIPLHAAAFGKASGGQAGKEMWCMPLIPHSFQTSKMGLWRASSFWHSQKDLNNLVPLQLVPPDSIEKHSLIYLFLFPSWQRRVG